MSSFKIGDKATVKRGEGSHAFMSGETVTITAVTGDSLYATVKVEGSSRWWAASRFLKVTPAIKVGDKVRIIGAPYAGEHNGKTATVSHVVENTWAVNPRTTNAKVQVHGARGHVYALVEPLTASAFKVGDKVRFIRHARYIKEYMGGGKFYTGHVGETATVIEPGTWDRGGVRVRYSNGTQDGMIDPTCLELVAPITPETFKVGARVKVADDAVTEHSRGAIGVVARYTPLRQTCHKNGKPSLGYYTVTGDGGARLSVWDFDLSEYAPTFKSGDRVERTGPKHFMKGYSGFDYRETESKHGDLGTVLNGMGTYGGVRVQWDSNGRTSVISEQCLKAATVYTFKNGDRVIFTATSGREYPGTVIDATEVKDTWGSGMRVTRVDLDGGNRGFRKDLTVTTLKPEPKPEPKRAFSKGDRVITVKVPFFPELDGKPATVVGDAGKRGAEDYYRVEFANGKMLNAVVKAYSPDAVKFRDLDDAAKAAKIKAGKIEKFKALAKELDYSVFPNKAA